METIFYTLHDYMLHTESITYIILGGILIGFLLFWRFLTGRDTKKERINPKRRLMVSVV